jgi:protein-L-isoaspartate(D-aspartate) O-methyltransferase
MLALAGPVTAIEIDAAFAARARESLAAWPQATVAAADGFTFCPDQPADAIVVNAGVTHLSLVWLDALAEGGRLLVPLTNAEWWGCFVMITRLGRNPDPYRARFAGRVGVIPCVGGRDPAAEERLKAALARGDFTAIPDETCWLAGEGWWLSTAPAAKPL